MTSPLSKEQAAWVCKDCRGETPATESLCIYCYPKSAVSPSPLDIAAIRARCEAATPGPWKGIRKTGYVYAPDCVTARCGDFRDKELVPFNGERWGNDATFIAHARSDIPALCDALSTAIAERDGERRSWEEMSKTLGECEAAFANTAAELSTSQERVRELEKDKARLDWLDTQREPVLGTPPDSGEQIPIGETWGVYGVGESVREAIDVWLSPDTQRETT